MKTRLFTLIVFFAFGNINSANAQWQVIYPPLPDSLNFIGWGISVVDENIVWGNPKINIANAIYPPTSLTNKYYYKTLDGGNTWLWGEIDGATVENDAGEYWFNAHLCGVDSNSAWVVRFEGRGGDKTEVFRTTDGGGTWVRKDPPLEFPGALLGIHFFNQKEGVVWGEERFSPSGIYPNGWRIVCFVTGDGGDTWEKALIPDTEDEGIVFVASSGTFDVIGDHIWFPTTKRVFHSGDRGKTWAASALIPPPGRALDHVAFRDSLNGIAFSSLTDKQAVAPKLAFHTNDGGKTWTPLPPANTTWGDWLTDVECVPGSGGVYWAVSQTSTVLTKDNGNTWAHEDTPFLLWFTEFLSPNIGWGAGAVHPTPPTSKLLMYKWVGDSIVRDEGQNTTKTISGSGIEGRLDGSVSASARFYSPKGMAIDHGGNVYVADDYNHCIRKISFDNQVSTLAGTGVPGYADGPGALAQFNRPQDIVLDTAGNLYVADAGNHAIRKIAPDGTVSLYAGTPGVSGQADGPALQATFDRPVTLGIDVSGNLYVGGSTAIRKISPSGQVNTVYAGPGVIPCLDVDRYGNIYFADNSTLGVYKRTPGGQVAFLAGNGSGCSDGQGAFVQFGSLDDLDADDVGNVYVADGANARIRKIDNAGNVVTLLGSDCLNGQGLDQQPVDGPGTMDHPGWVRGILLKPGESLLATAWDNDRVREIRLGSLPKFSGVGTKAGGSPHYRSVPLSQTLPIAYSGTIANIGSTQLQAARMSATVTNGGSQVWSKTSLPKTIEPGGQVEVSLGENLTLTTPGVYEVQLKFITTVTNVFGTFAEELVVSDSVLAADDGHAYFYDNIKAATLNGKASYGQVYTIPVADTLTGFSINADLQQASFYFSVYAMNDSVPDHLVYASDTVLGVSNSHPYDYYHRLPRSVALPPGKYLFALEQWSVTGSLGMGLDTDRNDQSAWYRSPDIKVDSWTPIYHFWGEQTAPVYMLRPVFGTPAKTVSDTDEELTQPSLQVQIAPNPVSDRLYVKVQAALSRQFALRLTDVCGKTVIETTVSGDTDTPVDVSGLPAGVYWVRVINGNGEAVVKVVKW